MDTALVLRKNFDEKVDMSDAEINSLLENSKIIQKLTNDYEDKLLFNIFRIISLSEIPYIDRLDYTQKIIKYINENIAFADGFSYTGKRFGIVPCYNSMLLEAYTRLGLADSMEVQNALNWIKKYQIFDRSESTTWAHDSICKYGGCMKKTPCYIGIGKTIKALITYAEFTDHQDEEVEALIQKGVNYMLSHNMYQRLSNGRPISKHITNIMFPGSYMLTITDLVYIINKMDLWNDQRTDQLQELINSKITEKNGLKIDYIYSHKGYKAFETKRNSSQWLTYLFGNKFTTI